MKALIASVVDSLYLAWAIGSKDIQEALRNKNTRINIIMTLGITGFFYWSLTLRPFDRNVDVVLYNQGTESLEMESAELQDGSVLTFEEVSSLDEMGRAMVYKNLGLVLPSDFEQSLDSGEETVLTGYLLWAQRGKVAELESKYSQQLSELFGKPVQVSIGENILKPPEDAQGYASVAGFHVLFAIFWVTLSVVPFLMLEEKQTKTMEALLVSPVSAGQVVLGKAISGLFYALVIGGFALFLNRIYVTNWWLVALAFLSGSVFSIGVSLVAGNVVKTPQQTPILTLPILLFLLIPGFFAREPNLAPAINAVMPWLPSTAMTNLFGLAMSDGGGYPQLLRYVGLMVAYSVPVYALLVWQVRRSEA